jgi:hypothetical protein
MIIIIFNKWLQEVAPLQHEHFSSSQRNPFLGAELIVLHTIQSLSKFLPKKQKTET